MPCSLTDEPDTNDTITLLVTAFGLQGNAIDVEPLLQYDKGVHNLTRANYGNDYTTRVNVTGQASHVPLRCWDPHILTQAPAFYVPSRPCIWCAGCWGPPVLQGWCQHNHPGTGLF